jgi:hypothetical protein
MMAFFLATFGRKPLHHPGKGAHHALSLPPEVKRLRHTVLPGPIAPPQAIAIEEDHPAQHAPDIGPRLAMALREDRPEPLICGSVKR